ncbi:FAD-dependent oxidoreductase [Nocardioides humi]|uniref:FAD-dependent oxidoreductase n=1 Tax=Nocardioides humi TaxID=449461 RepID=A0ABN2BE49_9ACTN|nr:FAD-dependent oxidoreductase [Nocardioides humi]
MSSVVVVGSGAAGLAAALAARRGGADLTVLEAAPRIGGTTALSAGAAWLPATTHLARAGIADSPAAALEYLRSVLVVGWTDASMLEAFCADAGRVADLLEELTPLRWQVQEHPDYYERPGSQPRGRVLEPAPLPLTGGAADVERQVHLGEPGDLGTVPVTFGDTLHGKAAHALPDGAEPLVTMGRGLVVALAAGAVAAGVVVRTGCRATRLLTDRNAAVVGVATSDEEFLGRVVLASGGFERDPGLTRAFLRGPAPHALGVASVRGDGLRMAMAAGADLANMSEAWWCPAYRIPGETVAGGEPRSRIVFPSHRAAPGSIVVDADGRRYADEASNYNDFGRTMTEISTGRHEFGRSPSWLVFDAVFRSGHASFLPPDSDPAWCRRSATWSGLAAAIGVRPDVLEETVRRVNGLAAGGRDTDFGRGDFAYDRFHGDQGVTLGPLVTPPFYALEIHPGAIGTKGGPRTDAEGRVQRPGGSGGLPGLYAAGNVAASPFGAMYAGGGGTIGPALVFGFRAGEAAAADATAEEGCA